MTDVIHWTIKVGGDDSWTTLKILVNQLKGYHVKLDGLEGTYELAHINDLGLYVWPLNDEHERIDQEEWSFISSIPGNAYPHFQGMTIL